MDPENNLIFCTLFDSNYLDKGLALYHSMKKHMDGFRLYIFAFDDKSEDVLRDMDLDGVIVVSLEEIMTAKLREIQKERTRAEFCWTCTPIVIEHVLIRYQEAVCTYIDADIYFFANPQNEIMQIKEHNCSVGITPHRFDESYLSVQEIFCHGKYCVQFNTFFHNSEGLNVLNDWKRNCLQWCYRRTEDGKFGDQKYVDSWKAKYSCIYESKNPGIGVAPWNLHLYPCDGKEQGRIRMRYQGVPFFVIFYHFEGMEYLDDGKVYLNLWRYDRVEINRKKALIYDEYFNELRDVRRKLRNQYGISFRHMQMGSVDFKKKRCSLQVFCKNRGVLAGFKEWYFFKINNLVKFEKE